MDRACGEQAAAGIQRELLQHVSIGDEVDVRAPGRWGWCSHAVPAPRLVAVPPTGARQFLDYVVGGSVEATHGIAVDDVNDGRFSAEDQFVRKIPVYVRHDRHARRAEV